MKREIKFRIWYEDTKQLMPVHTMYSDIKGNGVPLNQAPDFAFNYPKEILTQYTGLTDRNGKEIYEGDIIEVRYNHIGYIVVKFIDGGFNISMYDLRKCFISGNIFQNPELINK